jgi:hypothetical protein
MRRRGRGREGAALHGRRARLGGEGGVDARQCVREAADLQVGEGKLAIQSREGGIELRRLLETLSSILRPADQHVGGALAYSDLGIIAERLGQHLELLDGLRPLALNEIRVAEKESPGRESRIAPHEGRDDRLCPRRVAFLHVQLAPREFHPEIL